MKILLCIDDTDNLESKGTGSIATEIKEIIEHNKWGTCGFITRHQLLLHKDVPYTSHNSSMCFDAEIKKEHYMDIVQASAEYLKNESAEGSDPGICIVIIDKINEKEKLINYGIRAKRQIIKKEEAYKLAKELNIYLEEKGGDGQGVIGALAGAGLRLGKNDGELKGGVSKLQRGEYYKVSEMLKYKQIDQVCTADMDILNNNEIVKIGWKAKPVLSNGKFIVIVKKNEEKEWITLNKSEIRTFGDEKIYKIICENFSPDVEEEKVSGEAKTCLNCKYRRWTEKSFICMIDKH